MTKKQPAAPAIKTNYLIRDIPPDLWVSLKARAADERRTIRDVLLDLSRVYIDHGLPNRRTWRR